jgi:DNA helicase-2/ATP-dependent DNA helicase PcrA
VPEPDALLAGLDAHQRAAVVEPHTPLAILAPAGSGKTRVLTRRIAYRVREGRAEARHVLAVTFTRRAAGELVDRLKALGVDPALTAGTFHALALAQLRGRAADRRAEPPRVLDRKARVLFPLLRDRGTRGNASLAAAAGDVAGEIEWAKARMIVPDRYAQAARESDRRLARPAAEVADLYAAYETEKRRRRWLDFDDLLAHCAYAIETDEEFAAAQSWRFRDLFVDEFQDATPLQVRLLRAWLGDRRDLSVVGDAAQAIYAFAGADAAPLTEFRAHFAGGRTVSLAYNYRSSASIVAIAEAALGPTSAVDRDPPRAVRPAEQPCTITVFEDDAQEAARVADACWHEFANGVPWRRMAVLFRTNAQSALFETAFARRGVPFRVTGAARFASRPAVRALLDKPPPPHPPRPPPPPPPRRHVCSPITSPTSRPTTTPRATRRATTATPCSTSAATTSTTRARVPRSRASSRGSTSRLEPTAPARRASTSSRSTAPRASSGRSCS